jgi:3-hydroxyisobutyrate dehydrogenase
MKTIAFAGLGAMGLPMAKNLLAGGFRLRGIDLNPSALAVLAEAGAEPAASAVEAATGADVLILMVVNAAQAEQVLFANGALAALNDGGTVCLMATCPPGGVEHIAEQVVASGRRFVGDGCLQEGVGQEMISRGEPTNLVEGSCY